MKPVVVHGTCVAVDGRGVLIQGASGSGKSALALQLIAYGATLVADDRTELTAQAGKLWAAPPRQIAGAIEARHVGILRLPHLARVEVILSVDMDHTEAARLPPQRARTLLDITHPCLHKVDAPHFPAAVLAYLKGSGFDT